MALLAAAPAWAQDIRIATYHAAFDRKGPGLLLRDLLERPAEDAAAVAIIAAARPDVLLLTDFDWDADGAAVAALADRLARAGLDLPYHYAPQPNTGLPTGVDIDGDGRSDGARDAQGYGRFTGQGGMALLSRWPLDLQGTTDLTALLWRDLPGSRIAPGDPAAAVQRLSSSGHWIVPVQAPHPFVLLCYHATPPVFDGPEDRNGRRNADETALWRLLLDGALPWPAPAAPVVVIGNANLDPERGEGLRTEMAALLAHPRLRDPAPAGPMGTATVDWPQPRPGPMRVSYVLPDAALTVAGSGIVWDDAASAHKLVWLDIRPGP